MRAYKASVDYLQKLVSDVDSKFETVVWENITSFNQFPAQIDWERNRLIGIKGARGAGKTTLVLQYLKQTALPTGQSSYVSLDDLYFSAHRFYDLGEAFVRTGGHLLALDEVHRYANWSQEIKNLYHDFPDLRIVFTGSSIMHLKRSKVPR